MTNPQHIRIRDYEYSLPDERIARYPLPERDASRLLVYRDGQIADDRYRNLADHIPPRSLLVFNNTRVVEARLLFRKPSGGTIEIFCLEPHEQYPDITTAMLQKGSVLWHCLVGGASKWKPGQVLELSSRKNEESIHLRARYVEKRSGSFIIELSWEPSHYAFAEVLHITGSIPLPPYLKREAEASDRERYQTVYAREEGSVAAPTAGLHFTEEVFNALDSRGIGTEYLTLHVGAGTFKPVKSETMETHEMHAEWIEVSRKTIQRVLQNLEHRIIAVGTTSLRTLESLYWMGTRCLENREPGPLSQWEPYRPGTTEVSCQEAFRSLLNWMEQRQQEHLITQTRILIAPGYRFRVIDGLITNFHQPGSTLLLLVAALIGEDWRKIYDHALRNDYRFLSYGDGSLLWKPAGT